MPQSEAINELAAALAKAQAEIRGAAKDAQNPHLKNRYADLASTWDACREALTANGLAVVQTTDEEPWEVGEDGRPHPRTYLVTTLCHASGQWISGRLLLHYQRDEKGLKPMQALGSALTYARRYGLGAAVGICPEDDDGEGSGGQPRREGRQEERRPVRQEPARQRDGRRPAEERRPAAGAPGTGDDRHAWSAAELGPYIDAWHEFEPIADGRERAAREHRMVQALITLAIKDDMVREPRILKPAEAGKGPARDPAKCWAAAKWLRETQPDWFRLALEGYVGDKRAAHEAEAADRSKGSAA